MSDESPCPVKNPMSYGEWHTMADRLAKQGKRQAFCETCQRWKWPHERQPCPDYVKSKNPPEE